ncbi:MAG: sensor histidine kinase [Arcobacter sp.]|nr:sensor histidine kinase [Arcobacter sp.]
MILSINRESIFFTISISFIISLILVIVSFVILMVGNHQRVEYALLEKYQPIAKIVLRQYLNYGKIDKRLDEYLSSLNYKILRRKSLINAITYNPKTKVLVNKEKSKQFIFRVLESKNRQFIYLKKGKKTFLIENKNEIIENQSIYIILVFAIILITLILSFLITLRKLMPLKILRDKVRTLGDENFDFECCNTNRKDEVSLLAMEFKNTAKKLKDKKDERAILIQEFTFSNKDIEKKVCFLDDIFNNVKDILMLEDEKVVSLYENKKLEVNFKLFSIAIKNLIDNAIKYSDDKKVIIKSENEDIIFENKGEKLEYELEKYFEIFLIGEDKSKNSSNLGLYIVHNILKANDYILEYEYKNGINIFKCRKIKG